MKKIIFLILLFLSLFEIRANCNTQTGANSEITLYPYYSDGYAQDIEIRHRPNRAPSLINVNAYWDESLRMLTVSTRRQSPTLLNYQISNENGNIVLYNSTVVSSTQPALISLESLTKGYYKLTIVIDNSAYIGELII